MFSRIVYCKANAVLQMAITAVTWLGYLNSSINPCVYAFLNRDFRAAFKKILLCRRLKDLASPRIGRQTKVECLANDESDEPTWGVPSKRNSRSVTVVHHLQAAPPDTAVDSTEAEVLVCVVTSPAFCGTPSPVTSSKSGVQSFRLKVFKRDTFG